MVVNAANGAIIAKLPIGAGCDGVAFDAALNLIYTSNGEGTMTVIKTAAHDQYNVVATIPTKRSARTIAIDPDTHKIYLPAADMEAAVAGAGRPKMIPGTFQVLVLGQ